MSLKKKQLEYGIKHTLFFIFANFIFVTSQAQTAISEIQCEYDNNPLNLDVEAPQFSWQFQTNQSALIQNAYQIVVSESSKDLNSGKFTIWNSGKINSNQSTAIPYQGKKLQSNKNYFYKIFSWVNYSTAPIQSSPSSFTTGIFNQSDWKAQWIGYPASWTGRVLYFRKAFELKKQVANAIMHISGIGYYELKINGKKVGDRVLEPGTTDYSKRILYSTYQVKDFLFNQNILGITIGPGWYGIPKLLMQMEITFNDGSRDTIISSADFKFGWKVSKGPIIRSSIFDGEVYDAREEKEGWDTHSNLKEYSRANGWNNPVFTDPPGGLLVAQKLEPIKVIDSLIPQEIKSPMAGVYVLDAGRNLAGWLKIRVRGARGTGVKLKFAESIYPNGTINPENLRTAEATDTYIMKGTGEEIWEPSFTYHGFRYVQIEGLPYQPKSSDFTIQIVRSAVKQTGEFDCSNDLLNRIHKMVFYTESSNLHSIPTDCPQRDERMGWMNDMTVRIEQAIYNFDMAKFYAKWLDDVHDTQGEDGTITDTAPFRWGLRPGDPVSASYLLLAYKSYEFYNNKGVVQKNYTGLKAWVDYLNSRTERGILSYSYWGDWSPPMKFGTPGSIGSGAVSRFTPGDLMSTGFLIYCSKLLSKMAGILGNSSDSVKYAQLQSRITDAFNKKYWNNNLGGYGTNNQSCNSFALFLGVVDKNNIPRVMKNLVDSIKKHDYHLTTGNICTKYVLEVLTENGEHEVAYRLATQQTYPSWGYMLANGATTLWERWENETGGAMNSHNHPMMGSVGSWFYKYVVGILPDIDHPGFEKFTIHPYIFKNLEFANGSLNTVKGLVKSSWRKVKNKLYIKISVPPNATARVFVPSGSGQITVNGTNAAKNRNIKELKKEDNNTIFEVGSGDYVFVTNLP